ncbi:Putative membrane fusion protein [Caenispirillum salinarum AK4]|uniref:Putative membrane fusion protein n=2 Tax=Caenispirillum TaxID=414051 RepID=K9GR25_9PROT|nr:Putative membrane fusion protein [Caenispirillum salinarum AK4]
MMKATSALAALAVLAGLASPAPASAAEALVIEPVTIQDRKAVFAQVESVDELAARARIGGTVADLSVDEGDTVETGEKLAVVTDEKLALQMQALDARIRSLEAELAQGRTDLNRAEQLRRQGVIPQARLDEARTRVQVLSRNVESVKAERSVIEEQASQGAVLAPAGGRVLTVPVQSGSVVMPGETIATIAADRYILRMELPERHARFLDEGDTVLVGPRGLEENPAEAELRRGTVTQVYPRLTQGRVVADVQVDGLGDFFVGERVLVYVPTGERQTFVVPADYLTTQWGLTFAKLADGTRIVVQPGRDVDGGVEILSGLKPGDEVVAP